MSVTAENITKEYIRESKGTNRFAAVRETTVTIESGKLTVLKGRSGSGKSTFLNMAAGLSRPTSGRIVYDDRDIYSLSDRELSRLRNEYTGVIPQGQSAIFSLSVMENVLLPFTLYRQDGGEQKARELLEKLGIAHLENAMPRELSGGELRRVSIARALVKKPALILADEPTADLDDENTELVFDLLKTAAHEGAAVLTVTHENGAEDYANALWRMDSGTLEVIK